jgi:hypothetical protein
MKTLFPFAFVVLLFSFQATFGQTNKKMSNSIVGLWSGKHITLEISENGATVDYDCAKGSIGKKISLSKTSSFSIIGEYSEEHGGPVRIDEQPEIVTVVYSAQIVGKKMSLTVKRKDNNKLIGKFTLYYGRESYLTKCR